MSEVVIAHLSDIHFGVRCDMVQLADLEAFLPSLRPTVNVVSGDVAQRARHGEFQGARRYLDVLGRTAPWHLIPGNHDVQWWRSPLGILGQRVKYGKLAVEDALELASRPTPPVPRPSAPWSRS